MQIPGCWLNESNPCWPNLDLACGFHKGTWQQRPSGPTLFNGNGSCEGRQIVSAECCSSKTKTKRAARSKPDLESAARVDPTQGYHNAARTCRLGANPNQSVLKRTKLQHTRKHTNAQTHKHPNAQTHKRTKAQRHKGTEAQRHKGAKAQTHKQRKRTNAQTNTRTKAQRHKGTKAQRHKGTKAQRHKHTNAQTHKRTNTQTHTNPQTHKHKKQTNRETRDTRKTQKHKDTLQVSP